MPTGGEIAVVGMACRYPGARDLGAYWTALTEGREGITRFDRDELVAAGADAAQVRHADFVPAKGVMADARNFDWSFFGYSRAEAAGIDPQQRVFLECASAAIDDAGIDPAAFPGWIGVYAGADVVAPPADDFGSELARVIGREKDFLATRVAYKLGLRGPAITVQTACSTSLTATHLAVRSLLGYECDAALAGGVAITAPGEWGYFYEAGGILSPDGYCRPFDQHAAGTVPSEGVGVVVLKRLEDALRDGDRIAAVILGSALNNDGSDKMGYTAPSIPGQSDVIRFAQQVAGIDPADLDYVEAHGTATTLGDPVEVQALTEVFRASTEATGWCRLGAVKSNIGHTGAASGVAGLIKTVLMLDHRELVPTLHYGSPNPLLDIESTPFQVCTAHEPWPDRGVPLAAVSSFGVGGTNAHVVVQAAPARTHSAPSPGPQLIGLSAMSADALVTSGENLAERLRSAPELTLSSVSVTLAGRRSYATRRAVVAETPAEAADTLRRPRVPSDGGSLTKVAFLFPGQGTLTGAVGRAPYRRLAGFRGYFDEIRTALADEHGPDLSPLIEECGDPAWFADTVHQQLGLFALGYALGRQLEDWGIPPRAMLGNSIGEYAAATLAGVWKPADATQLVRQRAEAMLATAPGRMAAVNASAEQIADRIGPDITIAVAGPGAVVLSGPEAAMDELLGGSALRGLDVRVLGNRRGFHSGLMNPAAEALRTVAGQVASSRPHVPLVSNQTGDWADPDAVTGPDYWAAQLCGPVQLDAATAAVLSAGCDTFVELGPGTSMLGTLRRHPDWQPANLTVPMLGRTGEDGERSLLAALGTLWEHGSDRALSELLAGADASRCALPPHPFTAHDPETAPAQRKRVTEVRPVAGDTSLASLWCAALGVSTVEEKDDFFALGGESLMVVNLVSQVRQRTGRSVSVAEFSTNPTFGNLVRLAGVPTGTKQADGVVPLSSGVDGRPIFLTADALDTTVGYRSLATVLGELRPVYGLEAGARQRGIDGIATRHVAAMRTVQPQGPYTIGGWSFGAVVAHEMAAQLGRDGHQVDLLICLDGHISVRQAAIGFDPDLLLGSLRLQADALLGTGPIGRQVRAAPELRRRFIANMAALNRYRPRPVTGPALVFKAGADALAANRLRQRLAPYYTGRVEVHPAEGDHWSMLAQPHARELATRLRSVMTKENVTSDGQ